MKLATRISRISVSKTMAVMEAALKLREQGIDGWWSAGSTEHVDLPRLEIPELFPRSLNELILHIYKITIL